MTTKKEQYRLRILKTYSVVVDYEGDPGKKNVPSPRERETFKQWRLRVLGDRVKNVTIHGPWTPPPQMQMSTIQKWSEKRPLEDMLKTLDADKKKAIKEKESVKRAYITFPQSTLSDLIEETNDAEMIDPAVREFFDGFLDSTDSDINTEELLRALIKRFNGNARSLRIAMKDKGRQ